MVLKKTIGAPLRFAPASREELAMEIVALRRKVKQIESKNAKLKLRGRKGAHKGSETKSPDAATDRHTSVTLPSLP